MTGVLKLTLTQPEIISIHVKLDQALSRLIQGCVVQGRHQSMLQLTDASGSMYAQQPIIVEPGAKASLFAGRKGFGLSYSSRQLMTSRMS